jgi:hypothetical protein
MASGLTSATATSALSRETPSKETPETAEMHIEKRLKRLWVRIGETLKRLRWTSVGRWWLAWVSGARRWVLESSNAANTTIATPAPSRETPTRDTPETAEMHIEKRLKRMWVRIGETLKRLRWTSVGRWWLAWVSGARWWVLGSSKAANVACSAVFDADTVRELQRPLSRNGVEGHDYNLGRVFRPTM